MVGKSKAIGEELYNKCKLELKRCGIRGEIGRRLQAIISAKEYGIADPPNNRTVEKHDL
ncbi:MAG: hypothetical protein DMENIID0003_06810 [Wolbachia endosymbiont of Sergentomyia squamirostris]|uniref:Uncharacterized protein n=1 Tax=Wolbachia endosymbiont of Sergentomyia squamirostris TaxID=3113640 RepID=A0AAT9GCP2_9RICK